MARYLKAISFHSLIFDSNVNQEAGKLRGLLPGDLGSLGRASLNSKQLDTLLPSVLLSLTKLDLSFTAKKRTTWKALDSNVRRHLEVCARLIACAQRQYLIERDWALLEDPNEYLTGKVKEFAWAQRKDDLMCARTSAKDRPNESSLSLLQQSPWVQHIIRPLLETVPMSDGSTSSDYPMADVNDATNTQSTQVPPNIDPGTAGNLPSHHHPLLDLFPPPHGPDILNSKKLVPLLYVIAACAEAFPSGSCWTSSAQKYWYTILPEDKLVEDVVHVKTCSSEDLALLIHILSNLLEACGNSTGDPEIQALTLLCLIRLTEAHSVFSSLLEGKRQSIIAASWRRVWNVLFRTDLRYFAYTVNASEGSCGEFVMVLLTEMVHRCCTDPEIMFSGGESPRQSTFLNKAQMQLWTLPAFSKGTHLRVGYTLELLCVFLHRMTLSDEGRDNIFDTLPFPSEEGLLDNEGRRYFGRRFRLTCLCLHFMESLSLDTLTSRQEMVGLVSASLSALVHGRSFFDIRNRTFARGSSNRSWVRSPSPGDALSCKFCLTEMPDVDVFFDEQDAAGCLCLFSRLWENPMPDPGKSSLLRCRLAESIRSDIVATERLALLKMVHRLDSSSRHTDYVPPTNPLRGIVRGQIKEVKNTHWIPSANEEESDPVDAANVNVNAIVDELASLPLSLHTLWVKVALSFCLSGKEEVLVDEIDRLSDELETLFKRINGGISHLCDNQVECWDVFSDLFQIFLYLRDLFSADPSAAVQSIVVKSAIPFVETCESLLLAFAGADREEDKNASWDDPGVLIESTDDNSESEDSDENDDERNAVDLLEDSDDDDVVNKKRAAKRQRKEKKRKQKRKRAIATIRTNQRDEIYSRKKRRNNPKPPNQKCACIIGSILITLDPSLKRCDTVINCLLGDGEDDKQVDLSLTYHCVILLVDKSILFHDNALRQFVPDADQNDESFRNLSPVTLFCEVLDLIRESADRTSFLHMFGFDLLAECVRLGEDKNRGAPLSIDESKSLVELLTTFKHDSNAVENDSIELRPHLRSHRLRQATIAFESGGDIFHTCIDGFFPKTFVIPSIKDLSASVRRDACLAVAAALHILRENTDRIMNTLERILPPISSPDDKEAAYHAWYERNNLEKVDHEGRVWEDARNSVESSAIYCRAIIAGVSNDSTEKMLYDFVCFSWIRPELEAYCFQACDKIAMMLGYKKAEDLITDQSECLIRRWLEDGKNFADIPLILSSPRLLRLMLETGQQPLLYENKKLSEKANESGMEALDVTNLKDVASDAFIDNYKTYILPQMLARFVSSHSAELSEDGGIKDLILQDQSLKEFCVCLKGDHESDTMMTIISSRLHDIDAYCAPLMHTELEKVSKDILRVVNVFLFGCDDEEKRKESRKPHLTIRQILELSGRDNFKVSNVSIIKEAFLEAISVFIDKKVGSKTSALLSSAGTSITECFLHSRQWLERATLSSQKEKRWSTLTLLFDLVFTEIRDQRYRQTQLAFGVNCLIDVVINPRLTCVRGKALGVLKQVLEDGGADVKEELSSVERRLVGSLMRMHEEAQIDFLEYCISKEKERRQILQRSLGVLRGNKTEINEDAWGWESHVKTPQGLDRNSLLTALKDFHDDAPAVVRETMTGTYDVLMIILDKADGLHQGSFVGCVPPFSISTYKQETLESIDARYCAQKACLRSLKEGKIRQELSLSIQSLLDALHNRSSWMDSMSENSRGSELINDDSSLTMSQWLIRSELIQLEQSLRRQRGQGTLSLLGADVSPLIQELAFVCGAPCPESLRYAASRCLGELDLMAISKVEATKGSDAYDWVTEALEMEDLLTGIQAQAIKVLAEYLYSANASVAIAALDTLIALLPTHAGKECWKILDENTQRALLPIASKKRVTRAKALSKPHLAALKKRAGVGTESSSSAVDNAAGWCWNMALWQCRRDGEGEDSFEEWICTLVPALIECCYNQKRDAKGINDFFCKCQMISCIAPGFASAIFPAIVLNLLESSTDPDASSANAFGVAEDTWIGSFESRENSLLSQSFEFLLGQGSSSAKSEAQDPRPIQLALDTLDLLRRATQSRFLKSDSHKRNSNSDGKSKRNRSRSPRESAGSNGDAASEYNKDLGATEPWKGLPFGTVLRVDGNLIVQALLRVQRYASALFYSDVYLDSFFRGSGAIFEKLSSDFMGASLAARSGSLTDISGYSVDLSPRDYSEVEERALQSLKMLRQCFLKLHEDDAHQAVQRQASDLKSHSGSSVDLFGDLESSRALFPSLADLQRLDAISNYGKRPVASSMCDTMEFLGLQNLLQSYINGIERHQMTHMSDYERRSLRDKWFESRLYGMKWDKSLLDFPEADFEARSNHLAEVVMGQAELSQEEMGFHESITKALTAYARDDFQSCQGLLSAARRSLLNQVKANLLGESSLQGLNFLVERLQSLNDIDSLASKLETPGDTLKRWGFIVNEKSGTDSMGVPGIAMNRQKGPRVSVGFSSFVREIVLRILRFKSVERPAVDQFDPEKCLISHLWDVCSSNRKLSNQSVAEGALYRLRSVLRANTERESSEDSTSLNVALRERLEEASLMESKEDFGFAIRLSKQTITSLKEEKKQGRRGTDASIDALLVDSLIQCGSWLSKYKIEPARTILDSYHKPGARMAKSLYQENNSPENSQRYLKAQIALARLASSLYDTVLARIRSPEWQKSGRSLSERETELMNCKTLVEDAGQRKAELKRKKASQKEQEKAQQEWSELAHYFATLRNEILLVKKERSKTEASVKDHLRLAVDSYASALALSGVGEGMDMSRHVFRMIDLWLHTCSNVKDKVDLNSIMAQAIKRIPSYRFVPLTSQLFAQIDSKSDSAFQQVLHNLVKRMCIDHPYHCLVQLISVCNGREVGSGVSGRCAR